MTTRTIYATAACRYCRELITLEATLGGDGSLWIHRDPHNACAITCDATIGGPTTCTACEGTGHHIDYPDEGCETCDTTGRADRHQPDPATLVVRDLDRGARATSEAAWDAWNIWMASFDDSAVSCTCPLHACDPGCNQCHELGPCRDANGQPQPVLPPRTATGRCVTIGHTYTGIVAEVITPVPFSGHTSPLYRLVNTGKYYSNGAPLDPIVQPL